MRLIICTILGLGLVLLASVITTGTSVVPAGSLVIYQGVLLGTSGNPVGAGQYDVTFRIFDQPTGGEPLWEDTRLVEASAAGVIWVSLGPISNAVLYGTVTGDSVMPMRYLEVQPSWSDPILPRVQIVRAIEGYIPSNSLATAVAIDTLGDTLHYAQEFASQKTMMKAYTVENRAMSRQLDSLRKLLQQLREGR
ncbi:MAG: hypothetical protein AB1644_12635 [Candidatus Zixiibacteriota bacterium]